MHAPQKTERATLEVPFCAYDVVVVVGVCPVNTGLTVPVLRHRDDRSLLAADSPTDFVLGAPRSKIVTNVTVALSDGTCPVSELTQLEVDPIPENLTHRNASR